MKNLILMACTVLFLTVFNACQKEIEVSKKNEKNVSETEFALNSLNKIGNDIMKISNELQLEGLVYSEISKQFDGDNNVLIRNLDDALKLRNTSLSNLINNDLKSGSTLTYNLGIITDSEGQNHYPQIYIPNIEELKKNNILGTKPPILVIYVSGIDENRTEFDGYFLNDNKLEKMPFQITEAYSKSNEVWVLSVNERVNNNGEVSSNSSSSPILKSAKSAINCQIQNMKIKSHKESWVSGASDVSIRTYKTYSNIFAPNTTQEAIIDGDCSSSSYLGIDIRKFSRNEVSNKKNILINFNLESNWKVDNFYTDPVRLLYVIFESDGWPAGVKSFTIYENGAIVNLYYRSTDHYYDAGSIYGNTLNGSFSSVYAGSYSVSNSEIEFNTTLY
jgi:hypothetical protein